ncbi:fam-l protein [Plasmodium brasilianum]|uniref:Uncharacterized protein n=2 Tax=Plasmodium (Plasmodium) TaxID=418103 RepID=A0A1A8WVL4_PLAMA|nr:fam-l protein [Plasmodium brasilianum]SBS95361.1 hypothetical protein PMALA_047040 [Plasmodium malariae]
MRLFIIFNYEYSFLFFWVYFTNLWIKITSLVKNYRLLEKYEQDIDSNIIELKEEMPNNNIKMKNDISYNNEEASKVKKNQSNRNLSKYARRHKKNKKNKSSIFKEKKNLKYLI